MTSVRTHFCGRAEAGEARACPVLGAQGSAPSDLRPTLQDQQEGPEVMGLIFLRGGNKLGMP